MKNREIQEQELRAMRSNAERLARGIAWLTIFLFLAAAQAGAKTWTATGTNNWFVDGNWSPSGVPQAGDDVVITNVGVTVLLTNAAPASGWLSSLTISNTATLIFSNWTTSLSATNVTIANQATVTLPPPFTNNVMSNRVWLVCSNFFLAANAVIEASERGYAGVANVLGQGPGGGSVGRAGAGHGGFGGNFQESGGRPYGSETVPETPGSSGGNNGATPGGHGGGVVRIDASGAMTIYGGIKAKGGSSVGLNGGGAGGSILITCLTLSGTNGLITADGGNYAAGNNVAAGGGGRIAINYNQDAQAGLSVPGITISALGGIGAAWPGDVGTVSLTDARFLSTTPAISGRLVVPAFTNWGVDSLTISNVWLRLPNAGMKLTVTNDLRITGAAGVLEMGGNAILTNRVYRDNSRNYVVFSDTPAAYEVRVGGNLILTNGGQLTIYAGFTNSAAPGYGALVAVTGSLVVASGSTLSPSSHPTNGGSVLFTVGQNLAVLNSGSINADKGGYAAGSYASASFLGYGPGAASVVYQAGTGYGGCGGNYNNGQGLPYGSLTDPSAPGSGSGGASCSAGGGLIRVQVASTARVDGVLTACAGTGDNASGSGGGISLTCSVFLASGGVLKADGRADSNIRGGGGGGRIAVRYDPAQQALAPIPNARFSVLPGITNNSGVYTGYRGDLGTLYFPDNRFLSDQLVNFSGQFPAVTNWSANNLVVSNNWVRFGTAPLQITVTNNIQVIGSQARLDLGGGAVQTNGYFRTDLSGDLANGRVLYSTNSVALQCGGNLTLTNGGRLYVFSGPTNAPLPSYGGSLSVGGQLLVASNSWLMPVSHATNGGSVFVSADSVSILAGGGICASAMGYAGGSALNTAAFGPGAGGNYRGGGGYGGAGGASGNNTPGGVYGLSNAPACCGSGGGSGDSVSYGYFGGGLVWIQAGSTFRLDGAILADGASAANSSGCGSGGGILLDCRSLAGAGTLSACGGSNAVTSASGGSGGGGRIAVWYGKNSSSYRTRLYQGQESKIGRITFTPNVPGFTGPVSAAGGTSGQGYRGGTGTVSFVYLDAASGLLLLVH